MSNEGTSKLTATVSRETDLALRAYPGAPGMHEGDLSRFIEDAVRWRMFDQAVRAVKARNAWPKPDGWSTTSDGWRPWWTTCPWSKLGLNPFDNFLLATAQVSRADALATGYKRDLLALSNHQGTQILTARAAIDDRVAGILTSDA